MPSKFKHLYKNSVLLALTTDWQLVEYGFASNGCVLANDEVFPSVKSIDFSYDRENIHGKVMTGEALSMEGNSHTRIWLRGSAGNEEYRLIVW